MEGYDNWDPPVSTSSKVGSPYHKDSNKGTPQYRKPPFTFGGVDLQKFYCGPLGVSRV